MLAVIGSSSRTIRRDTSNPRFVPTACRLEQIVEAREQICKQLRGPRNQAYFPPTTLPPLRSIRRLHLVGFTTPLTMLEVNPADFVVKDFVDGRLL